MKFGRFIGRRAFLRAGAGAAETFLFGIPRARSESRLAQERTTGARHGIVHVIVFAHFEGWPVDPEPAVQWFEGCSRAHPSVLWTYMYSPWHLILKSPEVAKSESVFSPFLLESQSKRKAEIGLHIHLDYELMK